MSIEAISALGLSAATQGSALAGAAPAAPGNFGAMLDGIERLNGQMRANDMSIRELALGGTDNLHQVMMNLEHTRLEFELLLQVRNKTLEAYQELMRMQV